MATPLSRPGCPRFVWYFTGLALVGLGAAAAAERPAAPASEAEAFLFTPPGFAREGVPTWADPASHPQLRIVVRDAATGGVTPCRINVVGPDGNYYQPPRNPLSLYALTGAWPKVGSKGNRVGKAPFRYVGRFFYTPGDVTVPVPAGTVRVEVWKGLEYRPHAVQVEVGPAGVPPVEVRLERTVPMAPAGYHAGDSHLHLPRLTEEDDRILFDLLEAEDLRHGYVLTYNEPAGPYAGIMGTLDYPQQGIGPRTERERGGRHLVSGQEYRSTTYGHLNVYQRDELLFPGRRFNANDWPVFGEVGRDTRARGGFTFMAHGGYAQEIWAAAALEAVDAVELLQFGVYRGIELQGWYHILNSGYRLAAQGASDYPPCRTLADCRTYAHTPAPPSPSEWLAAVAAGRSFFTTGPLLLLEVEGAKPGAELRRTGAGPHRVRARVRVRCEVTPVTDVELIVNGVSAHRLRAPRSEGQGRWLEFEHDLALTESSWIAARAHSRAPVNEADAEAHTNPVFVLLDGRAPYRQASLDAWIGHLDRQIATHTRRVFPERARVLAYFQQARDVLLGIRARGGRVAGEPPAKLGARSPAAPAGRDLAADGSLAQPTDEELRRFLRPTPPPPPEQLLRSLELAPGFRAELVAAEPLVHDPIAAVFDEDGVLYVAEMTDYPYNTNQPVRVAWQDKRPPSDGRPRGAVRRLRDTDGDGRFDESVVFADGLLWAGGLQPWKGGLFVASPPHLWYLKDTDGDGKADVREIVFTGFGTENQQGMVNSLILGLDHRIYGSSSVNGGEIRNTRDPAAPAISVRGRDFRFDPVTLRLEPLAGTRQFGMSFDDWGNRFLCSQSEPAVHAVLPLQYLERNPHFTPPAVLHRTTPSPTPIHRISPVEPWRHLRSSRRVAEATRAADGAGVSHHVFDAGAGITVYRGGAFPPEYRGSVFLGDSVNNLVHRRVLVPDGATFRSERAEAGGEFARASDRWFRPVNFVNAPDGTLLCLDMAREHSETINIPADVEKHLDLTSGRDRGRIFRITPEGFQAPPPPRLGRATSGELLAALESPHGWWRDTAHRLIHERQDRSLAPALARLAVGGASPQARVHALWSLRGLRALEDEILARALADPHPGVRLNAVRLAEARLGDAAALRARVRALVGDPDAHVRLQVAFAIGETAAWDQAELLAALVERDVDDPWIRSAVLSSSADCAADLLVRLAADAAVRGRPSGEELLRQLCVTLGARNRPVEVGRAVVTVAGLSEPQLALALMDALGEGLARSGSTLAAADSADRLRAWREAARTLATEVAASERLRRTALDALARLPQAEAAPILLRMISAAEPPALQLAAIAALGRFGAPGVGPALLERYSGLAPAGRRAVLEAVLARPERLTALWTAVERGIVQPGEFTAAQLVALRRHPDESVRRRATALLGAPGATPRAQVHRDFVSALRLAGEAARGRAHFEARCAACHRLAGLGRRFGPDLETARGGGPEQLLVSIIDPNRDVSPAYYVCQIETRGGESIGGLLRNETATTVTLLQPGGEERTVARSAIASFRTLPRSLMPEGLEAGLSAQDMADLLAFLIAGPG